MTTYIAILGGYPDVGKGILTASLGYLLKQRGNEVYPIKFDGYFNISSGTMNSGGRNSNNKYNNEEVFVLEDGFCGDVDSGTYERFLDINLKGDHNLTNGKIFLEFLEKEKEGKYSCGKVLEYSHVKNQVIQQLKKTAQGKDFLIIEVGGTIGDPENEYFIELLQEMKNNGEDIKFILLAPVIKFIEKNEDSSISSETKIIRMSIEKLRKKGIKIDALMCRSENLDEIYKSNKKSISKRCNISEDLIFLDPKCNNIYRLPEIFEKQKIIQKLFPGQGKITSNPLNEFVKKCENAKGEAKITIFGNTESDGSFISLNEAMLHSSVKNNCIPKIKWLKKFENINDGGIILTDNFNESEKLIKYLQNKNIPFLAIGGGFKEVIKTITSKAPDKEINYCGRRELNLIDGGKWYERYRIKNNSYSKVNEEKIKILGEDDFGPQIIELKNKKFFTAVQFNPEYKSKPNHTHPIIDRFIEKVIK